MQSCALSRLILEQCQFEITLTGDDFLPVRWMSIVNQHCKCLARPSVKNDAISQEWCDGINKPINHSVNTTFNISYKHQISKTTRILITSSTYPKLRYIQNKTVNEYNSQIRGIAFPQVRRTLISRPM